ncbi:hypothetical protein BGZ70_008626 [Mortierella alpina]|uniref:TPX2 C-terminal domain-containing protein n=1 Tax=Mortierella alpina TaxID=64518 RepID=A0A9P6J3B1_MORAP|nr:hypothetical protein BGZ70_008626 [Mortierella alpina]
MQQASGTSALKTGKAAGPAADPSRRGGQGLFSAKNTHTGKRSTANAAGTGSTGDLQERLSQRSIRALSALSSATGISNKINTSTVSNNDKNSTIAASFDDTMNNPFMEQPPRKVMKRDHVTTTAASGSSTSHGADDRAAKESLAKSQEPRQQQGLVLTRVVSMNRNGTTGTHSRRDTTGTVGSRTLKPADQTLFASRASIPRNTIVGTADSVAEKDDGGFRIPSVPPNHPSTTPKQKPRADYYDFLKKSISSRDIASSTDEESSDVEKRSTIQQSRKVLAASAMEFARKSIMQRATKSPGAAFRRVQDVVNDSSKVPSLHDLLTASDADDEEERSSQRISPMERPSADPSFAPADMAFTFESTPLPAHDPDDQPKDQESQQGDNFHDLDAFSYKAPEHSSSAQEHSTLIKERDLTAPEHAVPVETDTHAMGTSIVQLGSVMRSSMARRAAPYKVPTVNERELLRSSRAPGFRARPVDPKVFTGAGDLGVPRIAKPPLTVPVSPNFSKRRVRNHATSATASATTAASSRLVNSTTKFNVPKHPAVRQQSHETSNNQTSAPESSDDAAKNTKHSTAWGKRLAVPKAGQVRQVPSDMAAESSTESTHRPLFSSDKAASRPVTESSSRAFGLTTGIGARKSILGPPMRGGDPETAISSGSGLASTSIGNQTKASLPRGQPSLRRPLTQPVPFKFATNELLRRRHVMFQSKETSAPAPVSTKEVKLAESRKPQVFKRAQPLKRLTTPVPFKLATQQRAELRPPETRNGSTQNHSETSAVSHSIRAPPSRLAGLLPLSPAKSGHSVATTLKKAQFVPTVPISPKFGRRVPVRSLRPTQFLLKKSTKELTQPHEFRFLSGDRARARESLDQQSVRRREQELEHLRQKTARLNKMREQRESLERTFRARPIKHYAPITIHKATRPLTKPVSPMIGEKRKRHEMEVQHQEQQHERERFDQQQQQWQQQFEEEHRLYEEKEQQMYRQFEEAKILQEQQQRLQQQLSKQERRQVELANSAHATIHQPPIRLSFPMDPRVEDVQEGGESHRLHQEPERERSLELSRQQSRQQAPIQMESETRAVDLIKCSYDLKRLYKCWYSDDYSGAFECTAGGGACPGVIGNQRLVCFHKCSGSPGQGRKSAKERQFHSAGPE